VFRAGSRSASGNNPHKIAKTSLDGEPVRILLAIKTARLGALITLNF
jgi:hypothetical protein